MEGVPRKPRAHARRHALTSFPCFFFVFHWAFVVHTVFVVSLLCGLVLTVVLGGACVTVPGTVLVLVIVGMGVGCVLICCLP